MRLFVDSLQLDSVEVRADSLGRTVNCTGPLIERKLTRRI